MDCQTTAWPSIYEFVVQESHDEVETQTLTYWVANQEAHLGGAWGV